MSYTKFNADWKAANSATGGGDVSTPITDAALDHIETGIDDAHTLIDDHLADTTATHPAVSITITDAAGDFAATEVEGALAEIQTDIEALSANPGIPWQIVFTPLSNEPPASAFATFDTRNSHPVLDFDAATDEQAVFRALLPTGYAGGGLSVALLWAATSATSGNVIWEVSLERVTVNGHDIDADSFASAVTATAAADATSGEIVATTFLFSSGAAMDNMAAGEMFRLRVNRDANNGSDTMTGDAELILVTVVEQ